MVNMISPTKTLGMTLLHKCNFNCPHCGYLYVNDDDDHDIKPGYRMTWDQIQRLIYDCNSVENERFSFVINGGEPTLWEEGEFKFIDVLLAVARGNINPTYNTNGSYFVDYARCNDFLNRYADESETPLMTFISMDKFHKNYDEEKGRAESLDNIITVVSEIPEEKRELLETHVFIIVTKDPDSSLPKKMKEYYGQYGITFGDFPMMPIGKAKDIPDQLPETQPDFSEFSKLKGKGPVSVVLVGDDYYVGNEKAGKLGHLSELFSEAG